MDAPSRPHARSVSTNPRPIPAVKSNKNKREVSLRPDEPSLLADEPGRSAIREMNWIQRKIYLYNVTFGLYMLDWWERYLFNTLVIVLMWFIFCNGSRYVMGFCKRHL